MTYYTEAFEHAGLHVRIFVEEYIDEFFNPRPDDEGLLGVMFCDHRDYELGDRDAPDPRDQTVTCPTCHGTGEDPNGKHIAVDHRAYGCETVKTDLPSLAAAERYIERHAPEDARWEAMPQECPQCGDAGEIEVGIVEYLQREHGARVILPLFLYDHSGITMFTGGRLDTGEDSFSTRNRYPFDAAGWDTSSVGVIFDTEESRKRCGCEDWSDEKIEADLEMEVRYYDAYLQGWVYGYEVVRCEPDEDGEIDPESDECEVLDSLGGILVAQDSDEEYMKSEARAAAEACAEQVEREKREAHEMACRDVETK